MTKEQTIKTKQWLDNNKPTRGDGVWSLEYIMQCAAGQRQDSDNYKTVVMAIKYACPEFVFTNYSI